MRELFKLTAILTFICSVAATALALTYNLTKVPIAHQQRLKKLNAIKAVQPNYDNEPDKDFVDLNLNPSGQGSAEPIRFYITKRDGSFTGAAFEASAMGYGGKIEVMVGVNPEGTISGVQVVSQKETPGLGAKITEKSFLAQFISKNLHNLRWALKKEGGGVDQVSGATVSPSAVVKAIHQGLICFRDHRDELLKKSEG